jgi:hypothetical protein
MMQRGLVRRDLLDKLRPHDGHVLIDCPYSQKRLWPSDGPMPLVVSSAW